jgi:hypothetical protein
MDNADQAIPAPNSTDNLLLVRTRPHGRNERIGNGERHVGINQCGANLSETRLKVRLTDAASPTEPLE